MSIQNIFAITKIEYEILLFVQEHNSLPEDLPYQKQKRLDALRSCGYIDERETIRNKQKITVYELTNKGDTGIQQYLQGLEAIQVANEANKVSVVSIVISSICSVLALGISIVGLIFGIN